MNSFTLETASRVNRRNYASRISTLLSMVSILIIVTISQIGNIKGKQIEFYLKKDFIKKRLILKNPLVAYIKAVILKLLFLFFISVVLFN